MTEMLLWLVAYYLCGVLFCLWFIRATPFEWAAKVMGELFFLYAAIWPLMVLMTHSEWPRKARTETPQCLQWWALYRQEHRNGVS